MKAKPKAPRPFLVCIESFDRKDGRVWAVKQGVRWRYAREISIQVPTLTVYKGQDAAEPRAFLAGVGVVRCLERGQIVITG